MKTLIAPFLLVLATAASAVTPAAVPITGPKVATVEELNVMARRYAPVDLTADISALSAGDKKAIATLIEAAKIIDTLQLRQRWASNEALWKVLQQDRSPLGKARLDYFWLNKGPWSALDGNHTFMPADYKGIKIPAKKPEGANFYPAGATKAELEVWMNGLAPKAKEQAQWFFTTIRKGKDGKFKTVKYSQEY